MSIQQVSKCTIIIGLALLSGVQHGYLGSDAQYTLLVDTLFIWVCVLQRTVWGSRQHFWFWFILLTVENTSNAPFFMTPPPPSWSLPPGTPRGQKTRRKSSASWSSPMRSHLEPQEEQQQVLLVLVVVLNKHYPPWPHGGAVSKGKRI